MIQLPYKLLVGEAALNSTIRVRTPTWDALLGKTNGTCDGSPSVFSRTPSLPHVTGKFTCGETPETGCLFDVVRDPSETQNIANANPRVFRELLALREEEASKIYSPRRLGSTVDLKVEVPVDADSARGFLGPHFGVAPQEEGPLLQAYLEGLVKQQPRQEGSNE